MAERAGGGRALPAVEEVSVDDVVLLRSAVLRPGLALDASRYAEDGDPGAHHLAVRGPDGRVVGCATYFPSPWPEGSPPVAGPAWRLRGMASAEQVRGTGVGSALLLAGIDLVTTAGGRLLWCNARSVALDFYRRHGFRIEPEEFLEPPMNVPHHRAWRPL
ncbi:MAG TPA: GNAT family N-acetyltransferase [Actinomycetes bacterium]|nr:GNAT family N-acetyltransferase [Actinomycetes bacterium]